jgi:hypothetical protein
MSTFQIIGILAFLGLAASVPLQLRARRRAFAGIAGYAPRLSWLERIAYLATLLGVLILALTALIPNVLAGIHAGSWLLYLHVAAAPIFAIGIVLLAVLWADRRQYNPTPGNQEIDCTMKAIFWTMLLAALLTILSVALAMTTLFGSHGQIVLIDIHRYSSLALFVLAVLHFIRFAATR